jgi:hypothetical protein
MVVLLIVLNAAVSPSAHADTYLCIGEHYTSVTYPRPLKHHKAQSGSKTGGGEGGWSSLVLVVPFSDTSKAELKKS